MLFRKIQEVVVAVTFCINRIWLMLNADKNFLIDARDLVKKGKKSDAQEMDVKVTGVYCIRKRTKWAKEPQHLSYTKESYTKRGYAIS